MKPYLSIPVSMKSDFYRNLLDWSSQNLIASGVSDGLHLWTPGDGDERPLCKKTRLTAQYRLSISVSEGTASEDSIGSVRFNSDGGKLAVGFSNGNAQIFDTETRKIICTVSDASDRPVGGPFGRSLNSIDWNGNLFCTGGQGRITMRDVRASAEILHTLTAHRSMVCGLKWSPDAVHLASGANDNKLMLWDVRKMPEPWQIHPEHKAAVKAIAWSPHHRGLLVSGGGTADRCLRFWDTLTGQPMQRIVTDSQICNVAWSAHSLELVTTHGYGSTFPDSNQVKCWKYPSLRATNSPTEQHPLNYMAVSPDSECIITGSEELLHFWHVFPKGIRKKKESFFASYIN